MSEKKHSKSYKISFYACNKQFSTHTSSCFACTGLPQFLLGMLSSSHLSHRILTVRGRKPRRAHSPFMTGHFTTADTSSCRCFFCFCVSKINNVHRLINISSLLNMYRFIFLGHVFLHCKKSEKR